MFSKALFKQSCKANGVMWTIITFAVCFMLACVMLITGNGGIGDTKNAIEDTIIVKEIDASIEKRALSYYQISMDGLTEFDKLILFLIEMIILLIKNICWLWKHGIIKNQLQTIKHLFYY